MKLVDWFLIFTLLLLVPVLVMAVYHLWELSELKPIFQEWKRKREWKDTHKFIEKIKEVAK